MAVAAVAVPLVVAGISAWSSWYGQNKQEKAQESAYRRNMETFQQQSTYEKKQAEKQWKWLEEERDYSRKMSSVNQTFQLLSKNPQMEQHMINIWRS